MKSPEEIQSFLDYEAYQLKLKLEAFKLGYDLSIDTEGFYRLHQSDSINLIGIFETNIEIVDFLGLGLEIIDIKLKDIA